MRDEYLITCVGFVEVVVGEILYVMYVRAVKPIVPIGT